MANTLCIMLQNTVSAGPPLGDPIVSILLDMLDEGVLVADQSQAIVAANRAAAKILGVPARALVGSPLDWSALSPCRDDGSLLSVDENPMATARRTGTESVVTLGLRRPDGEQRWVRLTARPFETRPEQGPPCCTLMATIADVTEEHEANEQRFNGEAHFRQMVEASYEGTWAIDEQGRTIFANRRMAEMLGYEAHEMVGASFYAFMDEEAHPCAERYLARLREGISEQHDFMFRCKDASALWTTLICNPIVRDERVVGALATVVDVTERKRAEDALTFQNRVLNDLAAGMSLGEILTNIVRFYEGQQRTLCSVLVVDESEPRLYHGAAPSLPPAYVHAVDGADIGCAVGPCEAAVSSGRRVIVEDIATDPLWEGYRDLPLSHGLRACWAEPIVSSNGRVLGAIAIYATHPARPSEKDLQELVSVAHVTRIAIEQSQADTARRKFEAQRSQSQKMEALGRLAGGVAHDFNNLLVVINSYAELLKTGSLTNVDVRRYGETIFDAGSRAAELTKQLLAFTRHQPLALRVLNLNACLDDLRGLLRCALREDIAQVFDLEDDLWPIEADTTQLQKIIMNLASNAADAMPEGGTFFVSTHNVVIEAREAIGPPAGRYVRLRMSDTGMGMDEQVKRHAFEPFFTTKERGHGTGLGLSVVDGSVSAMHGHISFRSEIGIGTTFDIHFPASSDAPAAKVESSPVAQRGREVVLLVEDDPRVQVAVSESLRSLGYGVVCTSDGRAALAVFQRDRGRLPTVVLTDVVMPGGGGVELVRTLREHHSEIPVILMSGYTDDIAPQREQTDEQVHFLAKPFAQSELARVLDAALMRRAPV